MIDDLKTILEEGEGQNIEFKESPGKNLVADACAFVNTSGGRIFIGITDDGEVVGTDTSNKARANILDTIHNIKPRPKAELDVHDNIIVVTLSEGEKKPYSCSSGCYIRTGSISQKLSISEVIEQFTSGLTRDYDSIVREEYTLKDNFDERKYKKFIEKTRINDKLPCEQVLVNIKCAKEIDHELVYTNAGALFFRDNSEDSFFEHARIVCAIYKGTGKGWAIDAKEFRGSLLDNIDDAVKFLKMNLRARQELDGVRRKDILELPEVALKEAITNAACHRDYFSHACVMVEIFDDRVEIHNPGGLPKGIKEEELGKRSVPRNPVIADLLHQSDYIEKMGTGIKKMRDAMEDAGLEAPIFTSTGFFTVIFKRMPFIVPYTLPTELKSKEENVIELMIADNDISIPEMAEQLKTSVSTIERIVRSLVEKGVVVRIGPARGGYWIVSNKP